MNGSTSQVRLLVMVLVGWCALSAAPVVANSPALPAAFFVIAVGLVAAITLRFSTLAGLVMAVVGTALFAVSMVMDPATAAGRGGVQGVTGAFTRLDQLVPALVAAVSLVGVAVCASLASWEIDGRPGAIQDAARRAGAGEEGQEDLEEERVRVRQGRREEAARPYGGVATAERRTAEGEAPSAEPPAAPEEPAATQEAAAEQAPAAAPEQAAARGWQAPAERSAEEPAAAAKADRGASAEAVPAEGPAAEEAPAGAGGPPRDGGPAAASDQPVVEQTPKVEEPAPSGEPASVEEQPAVPQVASEAQTERREGAVEVTPAESAPAAGEVKGEEIAARDIEEKNGRTDSGRPEAPRPDWRHRRRADDDVARRLPRRRKR